MAVAYPYRVTVRRQNGEEVVINTFAYNVMDATMQIAVTFPMRWPGEEIKVLAVGPPPEACPEFDLNKMLERFKT